MADNNTQFKKMSFLEMLEQHPIEIPIIQRDYAQGRESQEKLFQKFLEALKRAFESPIELDFIYGDIKNDKFHPLDGQQRLTTLFLLHWYAAACSKSPKDNAKILHKFTYCTRRSSQLFCKEILKNIHEYKPSEQTPKEWIEDQSWFRDAWKKDPTVNGMIRALNSIKEKFVCIHNELWEKLSKQTEPAISFQLAILDRIGLSDDLYIKMNARGKALSPFENLKAQIDRKIEKEKWEKDIPHKDKFHFLIDTEWTDLIWKSFGEKKFDESFIRIFANMAMYAIINNTENDYHDCIRPLRDYSTNLSIEHISKEVYEWLYGCFRGLCRLLDKKLLFTDGLNWFDEKEPAIFKCIGKPAPTLKQRLLSFAIYEYAQKNPTIIEEKYYNWLRFIRNIIQNSNIGFVSAARFIHKMAEGCGDIYAFIRQSAEYTGFASNAVNREKRKARMISEDSEFQNILHGLEDTKFCYGNLTFPFHYIDTADVPNQKTRLEHVLNKIKEYFSQGISDLHRRALLTLNKYYDNDNYHHYYEYKYWSRIKDGCVYCHIKNIGNLRDNISKLLDLFFDYFNCLSTHTPQQLIDNFDHPDKKYWRYKLIKDPSLLEKSTFKYFTFSSDGKCYLIPRIQVSRSEKGKSKLIEVGNIHSRV